MLLSAANSPMSHDNRDLTNIPTDRENLGENQIAVYSLLVGSRYTGILYQNSFFYVQNLYKKSVHLYTSKSLVVGYEESIR